MPRNKYRAKGQRTEDGYFHSKGELKRWGELKWLQKANKIKDLSRQCKFPLSVNGTHVTNYIPDFTYIDLEISPHHKVAEDFKGVETREFKLKARLFAALYGDEYELRITRA